MKIIRYGEQKILKKDFGEIYQSLKNKLITTGPYVKKFEKKLKKVIKSKYAISTSSGTSAIHLALMSLDLKKNSTIIMPAINFISSYSMADNLGLKIFLADVDPFTGQMTPQTLEECIKKNSIKNLSCFFTMYLGGYVENIEKFYNIKKKYNCFWIEDACHAFGACYALKGRKYFVGNAIHSSICTFSFHPLKTITTGEGGALTTNNQKYYTKALSLRSHGILKKNLWEYDIVKVSYNYRLSDINCALGFSQLKHVKKFIKQRRKIYEIYKKRLVLKNLYDFPKYKNTNNSSHHLFLLNLNLENLKINKIKFIKEMFKKKIMLQQHYIPLYKFSFYLKNKNNAKNFTNSEKYFNRTVSLPIHCNLSYRDQIKVINLINSCLEKNKK